MDYKSSGVNIDAGNHAVSLIKKIVKKSFTPNVLTGLGSFAAGFQFNTADYKNPVLVSCTDGVGTKLRIAIDLKKFDTVGIDLVAMSVNDLVCMGAKPLFFLDYIACHALVPDQMQDLLTGMTQGCIESGCALVGGEMAEMNDMYKEGDIDLAGFCVGVVDRDAVIDGTQIKPGDSVYALPASGIHSNGYSLVRKVLTEAVCEREGISRESLLVPTRIYVKDILDLMKDIKITGLAHITGGGLAENTERILPEGVSITLKKSDIKVLDIFKTIQRLGPVDESEMWRVFNMGVGMVVISPSETLPHPEAYKIGVVTAGEKGVHLV